MAWLSAMLGVAVVQPIPFAPPPGSELLITDADGRRFVGFGTFDEGGLRLELSSPASDLRAVLIVPDGTSQTFTADWSDGRLRFGSDGEAWDVSDALASQGRGLWVATADGEATRVVASDDAAPPEGDGAEADEAAPDEGGDREAGRHDVDVPDADLPADLPDVDAPDVEVDPEVDRDDPVAPDLPSDDGNDDDGSVEDDEEGDEEGDEEADEGSSPLPDLPGTP
ncbi:MAG: hypothetical protein WD336_04325 [Trueperaceae bacterium]